ncbi:peptide ABC transporter substrate-binding protein [Cyanobacterium stanieri LEGE 03274]|uniref:Peptide ABC transporter substrate-binding protein n=1 Tax=Cyanobacterium stanieri LEGE 03274 TaxID=1828756 RepID=A0ABR9V166_9CHRO|nr:ABC transporter substrate-binding protein [Cyanobacterium stanieri]MBE9221639.1 peptide ABC transporter substrate-binding protein [Cyanobacterium stanieri LEGE 03274]
MKQIFKKFKYLILGVICCGLIVACNNTATVNNNVDNQTENNGRISFGTTLRARTLDPADSYDLAGMNLIYNVGESLYTYDVGTTDLVPLLATEMPTVSDDGLVYTIPLRQGVKFHDGTDFNGEAMKFSLDRFMENGGKPSFLLTDIIEEVATTDEYELQIRLKQPFSAFPALLAFPGACAVSPAYYTIGEGEFQPNELVATGPYRLTSFNSDSARLDVFEDYWGEMPSNEGIDMQIFADNSANLYNSFITGAVDVAYQSFAPEQTISLLEDAQGGDFQALEGQGTVITYMSLNRNQPPLDQLEVRQAIALIMNRELMMERVTQGLAEPLYSMIPGAFDAYQPVFEQMYRDDNAQLAKELLTQAGFSAENPAQIEIWYPSTSRPRTAVANTLRAIAQQQLDGIIEFQPQGVESATAFSNLSQGTYQTFLGDWYPDFLDPDNYVHPFLSCPEGNQEDGCIEGGAQNQGSFFYNERVNELINNARSTNDPSQREQDLREIQEILAQEVPYIPIWQTKEYAFAQNNVEGVAINPSQTFPFSTISNQ